MSERDPSYIGGCAGSGHVAEVHQIVRNAVLVGYELRGVDGNITRFSSAEAMDQWHGRTSIALGAVEDALFRLHGGGS